MKVGLRYACLSAAAIAALYGDSTVRADNLIWDASGNAPLTGSDGDGNWDTTSLLWANPAANGGLGADVAWDNATLSSAVFGAGTLASTGPAVENAVSLNADITAQDLTFGFSSTHGYYSIYDNDAHTLTVGGNITKTADVGGVNIEVGSLNLAAGDHVFAIRDTAGDAAEMTINSTISGAGSLTLDNASNVNTDQQWGTLVLGYDNDYTGGTNIKDGRLVINSSGALGTGATTISNKGALSFGGASTVPNSSLTIATPITITRSNYGDPNDSSQVDFSHYPDAIISANAGGPHTVTFTGPLTIDSTEARIAADTSTINLPNPLIAGPTVGAGNAVFAADGDFAGFINLSGDNTAFGAAGNTIKIMGGVEVNVSSEANLGGATSKLNLSGGTIHPTGSLLTSGFMTNFGAHDYGAGPVNTGVDLDAGTTFNVNDMTGGAIGTRGTGTINFSGANVFTGKPYFDGGTVNINDNITFGGFALRSPTFNIAPNVTQINATSTANEAIVVAVDGHDTSTLNIASNLTVNDSGGLAIGDNATANGTVNNAGILTVGNEMWVGNGGGTGTFTQTAGSTTVNNWLAIGRDVNGATGATGTLNLSGGSITKSGGGNAYLGEAAGGSGTMTVSNDAVFNDNAGDFWVGQGGGTGLLTVQDTAAVNAGGIVTVGRGNNAVGTVNQTGGAITLTRNANFGFVLADGRGNAAATGSYNLSGGTLTSAGEVYVGEGGGATASGTGHWTQTGGTANINNWFVIGREGGNGTVDISGGTLNHAGGNMSLGDSSNSLGATNLINVHGTAVINDTAGELYVGNNGGAIAVMNVADTASVTANTWFVVGRNGATGTLNLSGGSVTQQTSNHLDIGGGGTGTINVTGGTLTGLNTFLGEVGSGSGTLNLNGGNVVLNGNTIFANANSVAGNLHLNGGTLTANPYSVTDSNNVTTVTPASFTANNGGGTGKGTFTFNGGALVAGGDSTNFIGAKVTSVVSTGGALINTNGHAVTVSSALTHDATLSGADGGLTKSGIGTLTLNGAGANTYTGATAVLDGTLAYASQPTIQTVNPLSSLSLAGGATPTARLDVNNNKLTIASADPSVIRSQIIAGRNGGAWNGAAGIISTTAQTAINRGVGYVGTTAGQPVTVSYAALGDTDLNQRVNLSDYNTLKSNYSAFVSGKTWQQGDSDYDGKVALTDYNALKSNYNAFGTYTAAQPTTFSAAVMALTPNGALELDIDKTTGEVRLVSASGTSQTIDGFTIYEKSFNNVWVPAQLNLSGLPGLGDAGSATEGIAVIGGVSGGAPVTDAGVSIGDVFDTVAGASLLPSDIYWEYSIVGGSVVQNAAVSFTSAVPEPATLSLIGLGGLALLRRRRAA